jgi:ribosome biogenesis protein SLX9
MSSESSSQAHNTITKKAKQIVKHQLLLQSKYETGYRHFHLIFSNIQTGLEASRSPYSKSHARRLKRKAKEQIGGGFSDVKAAIAEVEGDASVEPVQQSIRESSKVGAGRVSSSTNEPRVKSNPGQIGEGKGAPLTKEQRKKALCVPFVSFCFFEFPTTSFLQTIGEKETSDDFGKCSLHGQPI